MNVCLMLPVWKDLFPKRKNKIYVDFLQNSKGQTIASAYGVRPRPGATVSTPLLWKEVNHKLDPADFTIFNIEKRLKKVGDLWKGILGKGINLNKVLKEMKRCFINFNSLPLILL